MPFTSIQDQLMPHIVLEDDAEALAWHYGPHFSSRLATGYTRLTKLGLLFGNMDANTRLSQRLHTWPSEACVASRKALCEQFDDSGVSRMLFFPQSGKVDLPQSFENVHQNSFTDRFPNGSSCTSADSGRFFQTNDTRYEVSLCDLIDANVDFVYDHQGQRMYWREDTTGLPTVLFVCVLSIYIVSCIAQNIKHVLNDSAIEHMWTQHLVLVITVAFISVEVVFNDLDSRILTVSDVRLFFVIYVYCLAEAVLQKYIAFEARHRSFVSPLTACLLLLAARIHYSFDTPYTVMLVVVFGVRNWYKVLATQCEPTTQRESVLFCLDLGVYMAMLTLGVRHNAATDIEGVANEVVIFALSTLLGTLLYVYSFIYEPLIL